MKGLESINSPVSVELKNDKKYYTYKEEDVNTIEKELKQAEKNEIVLNIFKNALTIEHHDISMVDPHDDSEDIAAYAFKTLTTIRQNELDKGLRQALRELVLKNAFPKELKAFDIIKEKRVNVDNFLRHIEKDTDYKEYIRLCGLYKIMVFSDIKLTQEEYNLLKEVLVCH